MQSFACTQCFVLRKIPWHQQRTFELADLHCLHVRAVHRGLVGGHEPEGDGLTHGDGQANINKLHANDGGGHMEVRLAENETK